MGVVLWLLLIFLADVSIQQCIIDEFLANITDIVASTETTNFIQSFTINSTYYNCLSPSQISGQYSSMSVSILYIRSDDTNNVREVRYNLLCRNSVWEIVGRQSVALRNNITRDSCSDCTDSTINEYHCTG